MQITCRSHARCTTVTGNPFLGLMVNVCCTSNTCDNRSHGSLKVWYSRTRAMTASSHAHAIIMLGNYHRSSHTTVTRNSIHQLHCLADNYGKAETKRRLTHAVTDQVSGRCSQHPGSHHKLLPVCMQVNVIMLHKETMYSHSYEQRCKVLYCQNLRASLMPMHMRGP